MGSSPKEMSWKPSTHTQGRLVHAPPPRPRVLLSRLQATRMSNPTTKISSKQQSPNSLYLLPSKLTKADSNSTSQVYSVEHVARISTMEFLLSAMEQTVARTTGR